MLEGTQKNERNSTVESQRPQQPSPNVVERKKGMDTHNVSANNLAKMLQTSYPQRTEKK